ncbi:hypothetical protein ISN44_As13g000580 [Arabidopsis suecica]|uniref:Uncharacterized protein n=1 Tax=Arabidopsis suecica TaxID=45249 RepID=A0A8T1XNJ1_ARASU|nr:hypothetical protein ISN44_As13g000580 [Arabidopsis suecica]
MEEYLHNLEKNLAALEMKVEALKAMRNELLKRLSKEEDTMLPKVKNWISVAEEIESKASGLLDKSISERYKLSKYDDLSKVSESTHHYSEDVRLTLEAVETHNSMGVFKVLVDSTHQLHVCET